jgi:hypothetical protein
MPSDWRALSVYGQRTFYCLAMGTLTAPECPSLSTKRLAVGTPSRGPEGRRVAGSPWFGPR